MNTLSRAQTGALTPTSAEDLRSHWRALLGTPRRHTLSATHHLMYQALLGRDWRRGFTPPTNTRKLANGGFADWGLFHALLGLHHQGREAEALAPFDGRVDHATLIALRRLIPIRQPYHVRPDQFAQGRFPFDAYDTHDPRSESVA